MNYTIRKYGKAILRKLGYDLTRLETPDYIFQKLLKLYNINKILDIGANKGQFAELMFLSGFKGKIISFEPQQQPFSLIPDKPNWQKVNIALGNFNGKTIINISKYDVCSSILNNNQTLTGEYDAARYIAQEQIEVRKLDNIYNQYVQEQDNVLLKLDVQGYERQVMLGSQEFISNHVKGMYVEMHTEPLYENEPPMEDQISYIKKKGFELVAIHSDFITNSGKTLGYNGLFFKNQD